MMLLAFAHLSALENPCTFAEMELLEGRHLYKKLGDRDILQGLSITIHEGEFTAFAGATGSGKSTLLKILAGLLEPDNGAVLYDGKKIEGPLTKLIPGHDKIAYLSQYFELRNNYRVEEIFDYSNRLEYTRAEELFEICQIKHLLKRRTDQLSGGERQRIALARVLVTQPSILLLDEPFSNLDLIQKTTIKKVLREVIASFRLTTVLVSHDPADILSFADVVHIMQNGEIIQSDSSKNIYYHPKNAYVAGLFSPFTVIDHSLRKLFAESGQTIPNDILFLRPEMLSLSIDGEGSLQGIVENAFFIGPFWYVKIIVKDHELYCFFNGSSIRTGINVNVSFIALNDFE